MILFGVVLVMKSNILLLLRRITPQIDIFNFSFSLPISTTTFLTLPSWVVGPKPNLGSQMWLGSDQLHSES